MGNPTQTTAWKTLYSLAKLDQKISLSITSIQAGPITVDTTRSLISDDIWDALHNLAREQNVEAMRDKMVTGDTINITEDRAAGHIWLRSGQNQEVQAVLQKMRIFVEKTHADAHFTDIVHIGIGGSDLGPRLVCDALKHLPKIMNVHFVANVDAADITEVLKPLNPKTTLFIIASKTFTTQETMMNAAYARDWLGDLHVSKHMIALSTNAQAIADFGIDPGNMFPFWDWVGGRFSVWSAIGMPIALAYGFEVFQAFLNGAKTMDDHFMTVQAEQNLPIMLALYGIWNRNFMNRPALGVLPYAQNLALLPNYLQQLDMESNGKSVDRKGNSITNYQTGPIVFGQAGTNGQHAFHQWLHQGTDIVPVEFIKAEKTSYNNEHQNVLNAHADAQAEAFADGFENMEDKHKHYAGGRPSLTLTLDMISPQSIGCLLALYEHKIFVQGVIWNINSFDQFGVELGKKLAKKILTK